MCHMDIDESNILLDRMDNFFRGENGGKNYFQNKRDRCENQQSQEEMGDGKSSAAKTFRLQDVPKTPTAPLNLFVKTETEDTAREKLSHEMFDTGIVKKEQDTPDYDRLPLYNSPSSTFNFQTHWTNYTDYNNNEMEFETGNPPVCKMERNTEHCKMEDCCNQPIKVCNRFDEKTYKSVNPNNTHSVRKSTAPMRSADRCDPNFKGATVWLQNFWMNQGCYLKISAEFSNVKTYPMRRKRVRYGSGSEASIVESLSGSDEENSRSFTRETLYSVKTCASCATRRTPLWRDAEDGTPLCNACGIRFKKYRVRCSVCWHIPKKDIKTFPNCPLCGSLLRISVARRSSW